MQSKPIDVKIFVSHYKKPNIIVSNEVMKPIEVGAALKSEHLENMAYRDDGEEDNISALNKKYCELTGIYYAWKHVEADYYGFCHYRRYFSFNKKYSTLTAYSFNGKKGADKLIQKYKMDAESVRNFVGGYDVLMQKPYYVFITNRFMYKIAPSGKVKDLDFCLDIIKRDYPEMYRTARRYIHSPMSYTCNMFIMKKDIFMDYCNWLFPILKEFDEKVDCSGYNYVQSHVDVYLAERLTGIYWWYLKKQKKYKVKTLSRVFIKNASPIASKQ